MTSTKVDISAGDSHHVQIIIDRNWATGDELRRQVEGDGLADQHDGNGPLENCGREAKAVMTTTTRRPSSSDLVEKDDIVVDIGK